MSFLAGKYVQPAKLNAITRQITNEEIDEPDYAFSSDDEVNNWNTIENRDVMNSEQDMNQKANDLDKLVELMKEKLKVSNEREKIQILTLTPESWSLQKTAK